MIDVSRGYTPAPGANGGAFVRLAAEDLAELIEDRVRLRIAEEIISLECGDSLQWYLEMLCDGDPIANPIDPATIAERIDQLEHDIDDLGEQIDGAMDEFLGGA